MYDFKSTIGYISNVLNNPNAALSLVDSVEKAILERANNPVIYEPFQTKFKHEETYYRIYVKNYIVYYVVYNDVMEVRRFLHSSRKQEIFL